MKTKSNYLVQDILAMDKIYEQERQAHQRELRKDRNRERVFWAIIFLSIGTFLTLLSFMNFG